MKIPSGHTPIGELRNSIPSWRFPVRENAIGALDAKHRQLVAVCELCAPQDHMTAYRWIAAPLNSPVIPATIKPRGKGATP